jgi:hypothetical protein
VPTETAARITEDQFQGIWRTLKSQLATPRDWTIDRSLEEIATDAMWEELSRFTYEQVSAAARQYIESGETKFPSWGQLLARIRTKLVSEQEYPKHEAVYPGALIARGSDRELIQSAEWQWLCDTFQIDPIEAFENWSAAIKRRGRLRPVRERSTADLQAFAARCERRLSSHMVISPCGRKGCNGRGFLKIENAYCYCEYGQAQEELARRAA